MATVNVRNAAAAELRDCADWLIEQATRESKGWDKGAWRNDVREIDRFPHNTIARQRADIACDTQRLAELAR